MSATPHSLRVALVNPPLPGFGGLDYWLRLEQVVGDDRVTTDQIAEVVDELYGIEGCRDPETREEVQPEITWDRLMEIARRVLDPAECDRLRSGTYRAYVKVIVSHPNDKDFRYKLALTVGEIVSVQRMQEDVTKILQVRENEYVVLDVPVFQEPDQEWPGVAKWLGSVWNDENGAINAPALSGFRNVVSWTGKASGTVQVKVPTVYDLVTIEVEGAPAPVGSLVGSTRDTTLRAFYRYQVYELNIDAPVMDETADGQTLSQVCGWDNLGAVDDGDDDGPDSQTDGADDDGQEDGPELGCLSPSPRLADPQFYRAACCKNPEVSLPDCAVYATSKPTQQLPQDVQDRYQREHDGKVSFIAVGPGPDGCGRLITRQVVNRRNCCGDIAPMTPHPENPTSMGNSDTILLRVVDGKLDESGIMWRSGGGLTFDGGVTQIVATRSVNVFSPSSGWCATGLIRADDGCSVVSMTITNEAPATPLTIPPADRVVSPGTEFTITAEGGVPTYQWTVTGGGVTLVGTSGLSAQFSAGDDFCGSVTIAITDSCSEIATCRVRSTDGVWVNVDDDPYTTHCALPGGGGVEVWDPTYNFSGGGYRAHRYDNFISPCDQDGSVNPCGDGHYIAGYGHEQLCGDSAGDWREDKRCYLSDNCWFNGGQYLDRLQRWVCAT